MASETGLHLPVPPAIVASVVRAAADPSSTVADMAQMIRVDPTLSAQVLRAANSACFGPRRQVQSVERAIAYLGVRPLRNLVLCFGVKQAMPHEGLRSFPLRAFWEASLRRATAARCLAVRSGARFADELFTIGLIQDAGFVLAVQQRPELADSYGALLQRPHDERLREERRMGEGHEVLGASLLAQWQLPEDMIEIVRHHHEPQGAPRAYAEQCLACAAAEAVADLFVVNDLQGLDEASKKLSAHGFTSEDLNAIVDEVAERVGEAATMFELDIGEQPTYADIVSIASKGLVNLTMSYEDMTAQLQRALEQQQRLAAQLEQTNKQLAEQAATDGLTGLPNRRVFDETLEREVAQARRRGSCLTLLLVDVDHFKRVNDERGHQAGDGVLQRLAEALNSGVRRADFAARYGGEEFAVLLPYTDRGGAEIVAERIRSSVEQQVQGAGEQRFKVTVSLGGATVDYAVQQAEEGADLLRRADDALYLAKDSGRNQLCWSSKEASRRAEARSAVAELRSAS